MLSTDYTENRTGMFTTIKPLVSGSGKADTIYKELLNNERFSSPHGFIKEIYGKYQKKYNENKTVNGRIFEYLVCETLVNVGIKPFYYQTKVKLVPDVEFDLVLFNDDRPVVLTIKTSLRERYKRADLEGWALQQVYKKAESYLITLEDKEAQGIQNKIEKGEVLGLKACVLATTPEYDTLLDDLKKRSFYRAKPITPCDGTIVE